MMVSRTFPLKDDAEYSQKFRAIAEFKGVL